MIRSLIARGAAALALLSLISVSPAAAQSVAGAAPPLHADTVIQGAASDIGVSIAANTATTITAANTSRRGFSIQNQTAGNCYLSGSAAATADYHSLLIATGTYYESKDSHVGTGALSVICASAGGLYGRQW